MGHVLCLSVMMRPASVQFRLGFIQKVCRWITAAVSSICFSVQMMNRPGKERPAHGWRLLPMLPIPPQSETRRGLKGGCGFCNPSTPEPNSEAMQCSRKAELPSYDKLCHLPHHALC
eukprot:scaffold188977_cov24-Tisochrysis_lutea.AAC.2